VRTNIWAAWIAILVGILIIVIQSRRHPGLEESVYLPGRSPAERKATATLDSSAETETPGNDAAVTSNVTTEAPATSRKKK